MKIKFWSDLSSCTDFSYTIQLHVQVIKGAWPFHPESLCSNYRLSKYLWLMPYIHVIHIVMCIKILSQLTKACVRMLSFTKRFYIIVHMHARMHMYLYFLYVSAIQGQGMKFAISILSPNYVTEVILVWRGISALNCSMLFTMWPPKLMTTAFWFMDYSDATQNFFVKDRCK